MKRWLWLSLVSLLLGLQTSVWGSTALSDFHGVSIQTSTLGQHWTAVDMHGKAVNERDYKGKLTLYFFGFTQCPDVCPTTLANVSTVFSYLSPEEQNQFQVVLVSVDPERDTPEVLQQYLSVFDGNFKGLTGTSAQIRTLAKSFKIYFRRINIAGTQDYTMEHSSSLFLFDKQGQPLLRYPSEVLAEEMAKDIQRLLAP